MGVNHTIVLSDSLKCPATMGCQVAIGVSGLPHSIEADSVNGIVVLIHYLKSNMEKFAHIGFGAIACLKDKHRCGQ